MSVNNRYGEESKYGQGVNAGTKLKYGAAGFAAPALEWVGLGSLGNQWEQNAIEAGAGKAYNTGDAFGEVGSAVGKFFTGNYIGMAGDLSEATGSTAAAIGYGQMQKGNDDAAEKLLKADKAFTGAGKIAGTVGGFGGSADFSGGVAGILPSKKYGGPLNQPQYEAEAGEVVDGGIPTAFSGGQVAPTSSDAAVIKGQTHEQGGVDLKGGERVFSDTLKPSAALSKEIGYTGTTYAKIAEKITKKIGKLEEQSKSADRFAKESAKRMLPTLQAKLDKVFENQEVTKQAALAKDYNKLQMKYGGKLPKLVDGGPTPPPTFEEWIVRYPGLANDSKEAQMQSYNDFIAKRGPDYDYSLDGLGGSKDLPASNYVKPSEELPFGLPEDFDTKGYYGIQNYDLPNLPINKPIGDNPINNTPYYDDPIDPSGENLYNNALPQQNPNLPIPPAPNNEMPNNRLLDIYNNFKNNLANKEKGEKDEDASGTWQDALYKGAVYAPTIYNAVRGMQKPQVLNADEFQNPYEQKSLDLLASRRYNIDPQLQSNRSSFNNLRENIKSASGGNSGSYLSNIQSSQINKDRADATAWATKNNFDNQYIGDEASAYGTFGAQRAATKLGIQDINDRNRAARNSFLGAAATGVSNIAQNEKHMSNLKANDAIRTNTLDSMYSDWGYETDASGRPTGKLKYKG